MKRIFITALFITACLTVSAQSGTTIIGKWLNPSGEGQVEIYKKSDKYFGRLVWLKNPNDKNGRPQTDQMNLYPSLRKRPVLGLEILKDFTAMGKTYEYGTVYDPKSGKTYNCKMVLNGDKLKVSGYIGMFIGRTEVWTKVN